MQAECTTRLNLAWGEVDKVVVCAAKVNFSVLLGLESLRVGFENGVQISVHSLLIVWGSQASLGTHSGLNICTASSDASRRLLEIDELALLVEECTLFLLDVDLSSLIDATFVMLNIKHRASLCQRISAKVLWISSS